MSNEPKFTPGPWYYIGDMLLKRGPDTSAQMNYEAIQLTEANMDLIRSAPDMYEALELMIGYPGHNKTVEERLAIAKSALSKARGETK